MPFLPNFGRVNSKGFCVRCARVLLGRLLFHSLAGMILPSPFCLFFFRCFAVPQNASSSTSTPFKRMHKKDRKEEAKGDLLGSSFFFVHHHTDDSNNELAKKLLQQKTFQKGSNNTYTTVIDAKLLMVPSYYWSLKITLFKKNRQKSCIFQHVKSHFLWFSTLC